MRQNISSNTIWEDKIGYSRAVRVGNIIEVSGTTAVDGEVIIGRGNIYEQAKFIFLKIERALNEAGAEMKDVVRTRMYVMDISQSEIVGRAHAEFFAAIKPATSMIEVKGFIDPELLIEIEVTAVISQ
ncbi:MAG: putative translation initiation inhibitor, yjgF family [Bacteroidetes bacterium]|nr:putative translation initiation inhibitor, yjgF family [Bacteroidota bacterium]